MKTSGPRLSHYLLPFSVPPWCKGFVFWLRLRGSVLKLLIFPNPYNISTPSFVYTPRGRDEGSGEAGAHGIRTGPADL